MTLLILGLYGDSGVLPVRNVLRHSSKSIDYVLSDAWFLRKM